MNKRQIMFTFNRNTGRTDADCCDLYNWLLDYDPDLAAEFKKKWDAVLVKFQKEIEKEKGSKFALND